PQPDSGCGLDAGNRTRVASAMTLTRVGRLDTLIRASDASSPLAGRLDEVARERLPAALAISLARTLPTSREVLVLRRVDVDLELEAGAPAEPDEIAARWAEAAGRRSR